MELNIKHSVSKSSEKKKKNYFGKEKMQVVEVCTQGQ